MELITKMCLWLFNMLKMFVPVEWKMLWTFQTWHQSDSSFYKSDVCDPQDGNLCLYQHPGSKLMTRHKRLYQVSMTLDSDCWSVVFYYYSVTVYFPCVCFVFYYISKIVYLKKILFKKSYFFLLWSMNELFLSFYWTVEKSQQTKTMFEKTLKLVFCGDVNIG